jgi:hypothetical protein
MCDKASYRSGHEEVPKPRTAEELFRIRNGQEKQRKAKSKATGDIWQKDYLH